MTGQNGTRFEALKKRAVPVMVFALAVLLVVALFNGPGDKSAGNLQNTGAGSRASVAFSTVKAGKISIGTILDAGPGRNNISVNVATDVAIDGAHVISVEDYELVNGQPNQVTILAPGLNNLEDNTLHIKADPKVDEVVLDGCLAWSAGNPGEKTVVWTATDNEGQKRMVELSNGVEVKVAGPCDDRYDLILERRELPTRMKMGLKGFFSSDKPAVPPQPRPADRPVQMVRRQDTPSNTAQMERRRNMPSNPVYGSNPADPTNKYEYRGTKLVVRETGTIPPPFIPDNAANIKLYRAWTEGLATDDMKRSMNLMIDLMEKGRLPTEFVTGFNAIRQQMGPLFFDARIAITTSTSLCETPLIRYLPHIFIGTGNAIGCRGGGSAFYFTGNSDDDIRTFGSGGLSFFALGKGDDKVSISGDFGIFLLEKNWGKKLLTSSCRGRPDDNRAVFYNRLDPRQMQADAGITVIRQGTRLAVGEVESGSYAERAGIESRSFITTINKIAIDDIMTTDRAEFLLKGPVTLPVSIGLEYMGQTKSVVLRRQLPRNADPEFTGVQKVNFEPTFPYDNFIVFGPGIFKKDLVHNSAGHWENPATGDVLEASPCFNFVFTEDE